MSSIDSVMISLGLEDTVPGCEEAGDYRKYPILAEINTWLQDNANAKDRELFNVDHPASLQADIWAMSTGNGGFCLDEFLEFLAKLKWRHPEWAQVFIMQEHDERFTVYNINELVGRI